MNESVFESIARLILAAVYADLAHIETVFAAYDDKDVARHYKDELEVIRRFEHELAGRHDAHSVRRALAATTSARPHDEHYLDGVLNLNHSIRSMVHPEHGISGLYRFNRF